MTINDITTVQTAGNGYLVNNSLWVFEGSDLYTMVEAWKVLGNTPTPEPVDTLAAAKAEIARIAAALPKGTQLTTLDINGETVIEHTINSLWYAVFLQPINANMPNLYVEKGLNYIRLLDGKKNIQVIYRFEALLPPTGSENLIFLEP
jgi:hypothetical protein